VPLDNPTGGLAGDKPSPWKANHSMKTNINAVVAAIAALTAPCLSHAETTGSGVTINITGYGTIAGTWADTSDGEFRHGADASKGANSSGDIGDLTKAGLQGEFVFQQGFKVVGQVVAKRRLNGSTVGADKDLDLQFAWLYGQYQISDSLNVRLGRFASPTYLLSDSLNINYSAPWLRAPVHLYGSNTMETLEGLQLNWCQSFGGLNLTAQGLYGNGRTDFYSAPNATNTPIENRRAVGFNVVAAYGDLTARIGAIKSHTPMYGENPTDTYAGLGLQYDDGSWVVMAESAWRRDSKLQALGNASIIKADYAYLAAGYRFGSVLPMLMVSQAKHDLFFAPGMGVSAKFKGAAASVRYDVNSNLSLKAQWDRYPADDVYAYAKPRFGDHSKVNALSAGIDFVF